MSANSNIVYRKDYQKPNYLIPQTKLSFDLYEDYVLVCAKLTIQLNDHLNADDLPELILNGENLELISIKIDDAEITKNNYGLTDKHLRLIPPTANFELSTQVKIYPHLNTALEGLYKSEGMFCTQCEAEGFHKITYFIDRPDVLSKFDVSITADKSSYPQLLANGNLLQTKDLADGKHQVLWSDPFPKPCYLFALVAGDLACADDEFITKSGRKIAIKLFTKEQNLSQTAHALSSLKNAMRWDEQVYNLEYDLDLFMIVAASDFNSGAMENKGLNIFNTACVLANPDVATDAAYQRVESVVAHEYFHNWSGNRVTCRDWFQLSLKEGFTVFRDAEFSADMNSPAVKRIEDVSFLRSNQFAEDAGPLAHAVRPDSYQQIRNFYTLTVYEKGAEVVRMLRTLLGDEKFYAGCALYFQQFDGKAATCDDFVGCMQQSSGKDLSQFMLWYQQIGTPKVVVRADYDAIQQTYQLTFTQQQDPLLIPIDLMLFDTQGKALNHTKQIFNLNEHEQTLTFTDIQSKPLASLLRGFSAPIELNFINQDFTDVIKLLKCETDPFNSWDFAQKILLTNIKQLANNQPITEQGIDAITESILAEQDFALAAKMMELPHINYFIANESVINLDALLRAYDDMRQIMANKLQDFASKMHKTLRQVSRETKYSASKEHIARRSLQNMALYYLANSNNCNCLDILLEQYYESDNLTERLAALTYLVHHHQIDYNYKTEVLQDFAQRFGGEPLAMDQWFSLQASSPLDDALTNVQDLLQHPQFNLNNPNKVRAVIGAFAMRNIKQFHQISGLGYKFVTKQISALDKINPQIAARMVSAFSSIKKFDAIRQNLMQNQLNMLKTHPNLSTDVLEQVTKIL